jgi:hypothetical protein
MSKERIAAIIAAITAQEFKTVKSFLRAPIDNGLLSPSCLEAIETLVGKDSKRPQADMVDRNQAAAIIGGDKPVSRVTLRNYELQGKLKPFKIAGARLVRYSRKNVEALLEASQEGGAK